MFFQLLSETIICLVCVIKWFHLIILFIGAVLSSVDETESISMEIEIETASPQTFFHVPNPFGIELSGVTNQMSTESSSSRANYEQNDFVDQNEGSDEDEGILNDNLI